jgi:hypothetical protein
VRNLGGSPYNAYNARFVGWVAKRASSGHDALLRRQALAEIRRIVEAHGLDAGDLRALADTIAPPPAVSPLRPAAADHGPRPSSASARGPRSIVLRVFYYLGGTLVFAGLGIYIQTVWQDLTACSACSSRWGRVRALSAGDHLRAPPGSREGGHAGAPGGVRDAADRSVRRCSTSTSRATTRRSARWRCSARWRSSSS